MTAGEMVAGVMMQRPHDRDAIRHLRLQREQFGHLEARHVGADRVPDAAIFRRGERLHVVRVHVARTAVQPQQDHRRVLLARAAGAGFLGPEQPAQSDRAHACHADLQKAAA